MAVGGGGVGDGAGVSVALGVGETVAVAVGELVGGLVVGVMQALSGAVSGGQLAWMVSTARWVDCVSEDAAAGAQPVVSHPNNVSNKMNWIVRELMPGGIPLVRSGICGYVLQFPLPAFPIGRFLVEKSGLCLDQPS